jgi:hypothetical protein
MKLPRVRFTVRRLMVAVMVTATAMGFGRLALAWSLLRAHAVLYANSEAELRHALKEGWELPAGCLPSDPLPWTPERSKYLSELAAHHGKLKRKYEDAMRRPWAHVPPDPDWIPGDEPDPLGP